MTCDLKLCRVILSYVGMHMHRVVWYMHDVCVIHMHYRQNCVDGHPKLLVV